MSRIVFNDDAIARTCAINDVATKDVVAMEELSECIKEISKSFRGFDNKESLTEEIADVYFILAQIAHIEDISMMDIQEQIGIKMERQINRDQLYLEELEKSDPQEYVYTLLQLL